MKMKKIYWLRRMALLIGAFGLGAMSTGNLSTWIKIVLVMSVGGYLLLMTEFDYEQQKKPTSAATEVSK